MVTTSRRRLVGWLFGGAFIVAGTWPAAAFAAGADAAGREAQVTRGRAGEAAANPGALTPAQVEMEFDTFALGQARSVLGLSDGQAFRFARAYRALQQTRRRAQRERRAMMAELAGLVRGAGPVADQATVTAKIQALDDHSVQSAIDARHAYVAVDRVLNVRQRARFRQFEQQMERKKLELLMRAQGAGR